MIPASRMRSFDAREGFELVDFAEVGLPVFRLTVEAITLQRTSMPTMQEFVLRAINMGELDAAGIGQLLGLTTSAVDECLETLAYDELIAVQHDEDGDTNQLLVTELGQEALLEGERVHRDETLVFDYDGIRCRPVRLGNESLLRAGELAERQAFQIRPYPVDPPDVAAIPLNDIVPAVRRLSDKPLERTLLAIRRIVRRQSLFRPAVGLVFRSINSDEHQIAFAIGNTLSSEHEMAFARHGGPKRPGLIKAQPSLDGRAAILGKLGPVLSGSMADAKESGRLQRAISAAMEEHQVINAKKIRAASRSKAEPEQDFGSHSVETRLLDLRAKLDALGLRAIAPYEQAELFNEALDGCQRRLLITSSTIDARTCNAYVVRRIVDRAAEGIDVRLETSTELDFVPRGRKGAFEPIIQLSTEAQMKVSLTLARRPLEANEVYFLVKDDDLAIVSHRPFLASDVPSKCFVPGAAFATRLPDQVRLIAAIANGRRSDGREQ
jgi:hypothetical protein